MKIGNRIKLGLSSLIRKSSSVHMSTSFSMDLLEDRVKFKFYTAENQLSYLKDMKAKGETLRNADVRIKWEIIAENLLFHLVGAMDSLLVRINKKYELRLEPWKVNVDNVYKKLKSNGNGKEELVRHLHELMDRENNPEGSWLITLIDLRNIVTHRHIINLGFSSSSGDISLVGIPNSDPVPYLERRIQNMRELIDGIMKRDPILLTP